MGKSTDIKKKKKVVKYQTVFSTNDPKHLIAEIWLWGPHVIPCLVFFIQLPHDNSNVCVSNFVLCFNVEKVHHPCFLKFINFCFKAQSMVIRKRKVLWSNGESRRVHRKTSRGSIWWILEEFWIYFPKWY